MAYRPNISVQIFQNTTVTLTLYHIPKYVPEVSVPTKVGMYVIHTKCLVGNIGGCMCIYMPHMKSLATTMSPVVLYIEHTDTPIARLSLLQMTVMTLTTLSDYIGYI